MSQSLPLPWLELLHVASTLAMVGLIWFVQLVHYPLFRYAEGSDFRGFAADHQRRTSWVVIPFMLTEAATAALLLVSRPNEPLLWLGGCLLAFVWLSTAFVQVPLHGRLSQGFDADAARRLVSTNWLRTVPWTLRGILVIYLLHRSGLS